MSARITPMPNAFSLGPWEDADDPISLAASALPSSGRVLVSDTLATSHLLGLQRALPGVEFLALNETLGGMREIKTVEEREHPYVMATNETPIQVGNAFSIEAGIYREGQWGMRLEGIVVTEQDGAPRCNHTDRELPSVI